MSSSGQLLMFSSAIAALEASIPWQRLPITSKLIARSHCAGHHATRSTSAFLSIATGASHNGVTAALGAVMTLVTCTSFDLKQG